MDLVEPMGDLKGSESGFFSSPHSNGVPPAFPVQALLKRLLAMKPARIDKPVFL